MSSQQDNLRGAYSNWMGMPVFLKITTGEVKTTLFCTVIGESEATVRVRIADEWDVEIYKEMVHAVDAFPNSSMDLAPQNPEVVPQPARPRHRTAAAGVHSGTGSVEN